MSDQGQFINIHTHRPTGKPGCVELENRHYPQAGSTLTAYSSVGLHPWFLNEDHYKIACNWLHEQAAQPNVLAIGEAGLDKVTDTPWALQLDAFQFCIALSESLQKPLLIHCVRAFSEIIALKKQWNPQQPWIFHGFDKNLPTARMLLHHECYLSFGKAIFSSHSHTGEVLFEIPANRFFLETDDADVSIEATYLQAAFLRGIAVKELSAILHENFTACFNF